MRSKVTSNIVSKYQIILFIILNHYQADFKTINRDSYKYFNKNTTKKFTSHEF